jgi:hypothetical protein
LWRMALMLGNISLTQYSRTTSTVAGPVLWCGADNPLSACISFPRSSRPICRCHATPAAATGWSLPAHAPPSPVNIRSSPRTRNIRLRLACGSASSLPSHRPSATYGAPAIPAAAATSAGLFAFRLLRRRNTPAAICSWHVPAVPAPTTASSVSQFPGRSAASTSFASTASDSWHRTSALSVHCFQTGTIGATWQRGVPGISAHAGWRAFLESYFVLQMIQGFSNRENQFAEIFPRVSWTVLIPCFSVTCLAAVSVVYLADPDYRSISFVSTYSHIFCSIPI